MNHKRVASSKRVVLAFLIESSIERKVKRNKSKKKIKTKRSLREDKEIKK